MGRRWVIPLAMVLVLGGPAVHGAGAVAAAPLVGPPAVDTDGDGVPDSFDAAPDDPTLTVLQAASSEGAVVGGAPMALWWDATTESGALVVALPTVLWILPFDATNVVGTAPGGITIVAKVIQLVPGSMAILPAAALVVDDPAGDRLVLARLAPVFPAVFHGPVTAGDLAVTTG